MLVTDRNTPKSLLRKARIRLSTPHTKILGTLLNRVDIRDGEYKSYYHQYYEYYSGEDPATVRNAPAISAKRNEGLLKKHAVSHPLTSEPPARRESRDPSPPIFLKLMVAKLTEAMGPLAPLVLRDHMLALGESSNGFPKAKLEQLVKRVSQEILVDSIRKRFEEEMLKEIQDA